MRSMPVVWSRCRISRTTGLVFAVTAWLVFVNLAIASGVSLAQEAIGDSEPPVADYARVVFERDGGRLDLKGEVLVEAEDGGMLLRTPDMRIWIVQPDQLVSKEELPQPVPAATAKELEKLLLEELPAGFKVEKSKNFLVAYNTDRLFAKWISNLYEKLLRGFLDHWDRKRDYELAAPSTPLVVIVFGTFDEYSRFVERETGSKPGSMVAYYNLMSNRVAMFDLTSAFGAAGGVRTDIQQILSSPGASEMVATIVHEGTHQLMFNSGMQTRFSDTPLWVNEGLAMYFETPDPNSAQGFRAIGNVNLMRLNRFVVFSRQRKPDSLKSLISDDNVLRDPAHLLDRYSEAWAFNYFLLNRHQETYVAYLKHLATKPMLKYDSAEQRLADFSLFFEGSLEELDREFLDYLGRLVR